MDGTEGPRAKSVRVFAERVAKATGRVVHFHDERLSSVEADWKMARSGLTHGQKKARRDALAAAAILQDFLQTFGEGSRGYATDADAGEQDEDRGV
jgi:putative Holliday junction resolvase